MLLYTAVKTFWEGCEKRTLFVELQVKYFVPQHVRVHSCLREGSMIRAAKSLCCKEYGVMDQVYDT